MLLCGGIGERFGAAQGLTQQLVVHLLALVAAFQRNLAQVDLVLKLQIALGRADPDRAGRGHQARQDAVEELGVKLGGLHVEFREPADFLKEPVHLFAGLFEQTFFDLRIGAVHHGKPSSGKKGGDVSIQTAGSLIVVDKQARGARWDVTLPADCRSPAWQFPRPLNIEQSRLYSLIKIR